MLMPVRAQQTPVCVVVNGACVSAANPLPTNDAGSGGSVTQGTTPWVDNVTQWASDVLGAMANYGTSPGAVLVPGVNAFVTNAVTNTSSYALLTNASTTGPSTVVAGSNYLLSLSGTFGGASVAITATTPGGTTTLATYTSAPTSPVCFAIAAGTTIQATVTGGTPSGLYATLGGVGPGGCGQFSSTNVVVISNSGSTYQEASIATGGTAQDLFSSATPTNGFELINNNSAVTESCYFREANTAVTAGATSTILVAGQAYTSPRGYKPTGRISVVCATTGHVIIARSY